MSQQAKSRGKVPLLLALALILGAILRLYPALATQTPFQMVSWSQLYNLNVLHNDPSARVYSDPRYDGYNNLWPGSLLTTYTLNSITGVWGVMWNYLAGPLVEILALIPFYSLARRVAGRQGAWTALLLVALAPSMVAMGGGLTKEGMARPLLYTLVLSASMGLRGASIVAGVALPLFHHLTPALALLVLAASYLTAWAFEVLGGADAGRPCLAALLALGSSTILYAILVSPGWWSSVMRPIDIATLIIYVVAFAAAPLIALPLVEPRGLSLTGIGLEALLGALIALAWRIGVSPGVQPLGASVIVYSAPLLLSPLLLASALRGLKARASIDGSAAIAIAWASSLAGVAAYLAFAGNPLGGSVVGRVLNLSIPGFALAYLLASKPLSIVESAVTAVAGPLLVYMIVAGLDPVNFNLVYHHWETLMLGVASTYQGRVYGDAKMLYLAGYMGVKMSLVPPKGPIEGLIAVYHGNLRWGFRLMANLLSWSPHAIASLLAGGDLVFNTGHSWLALV